MIFAVIGLIFLVLFCFYLYCAWRLFEKAGRPGWEALIPFYSAYVMLKIVGKPGWWFILLLIPIVNYIFGIWTVNMLSKSFGKDEGFTVGLVLLGFIFFPILALGSAKYIGPYGDEQAFRAYQSRKTIFDLDQGRLAG